MDIVVWLFWHEHNNWNIQFAWHSQKTLILCGKYGVQLHGYCYHYHHWNGYTTRCLLCAIRRFRYKIFEGLQSIQIQTGNLSKSELFFHLCRGIIFCKYEVSDFITYYWIHKLKHEQTPQRQKLIQNRTELRSGNKQLWKKRFLRTPCPHCRLIDSGDVAMYQVTCPQCGEIPPSRKHLYPNLSTTDVSSFYKCIKRLVRFIYLDLFNLLEG